MAYVLSFQPHSPLKRSFSDTPYLQSCSSSSLLSSVGTYRYKTARSVSAASLISVESLRSALKRSGENKPPRSASPSSSKRFLELTALSTGSQPEFRSRLGPDSNKNLRPTEAPTSAASSLRTCQADSTDELAPLTRMSGPTITTGQDAQAYEGEQPAAEEDRADCLGPMATGSGNDEDQIVTARQEQPEQTQPFRRWIDTIRRKGKARRYATTDEEDGLGDIAGLDIDTGAEGDHRALERSAHRKSESYTSSAGFITAIKSASVTLATASVGQLRKRSSRSWPHQRGSGNSEMRASFDSHAPSLTPVIDEATWLRSVQRRKILEEIVSTEEGYLSDMKVFVNVSSLDERCTSSLTPVSGLPHITGTSLGGIPSIAVIGGADRYRNRRTTRSAARSIA